jgi:hypothetical protein
MGLWETEDDLLAIERCAAEQEQLAQLDLLISGPPVCEVYEVSVQVELTAQGVARLRGI